MQHTLQLETIREIVLREFSQLGADEADFFETVLIRDGFYCGRCFTASDIRAVWFAEENLVKFYGKDGEYLDSRDVDQATEVTRRHAA